MRQGVEMGSPAQAKIRTPGRSRSPWLQQLDAPSPPRPLDRDMAADVVVVGAGIAGIATAYFILRHTASSVTMVERARAGHGASGRNAGQLVTYFERPLCSLVEEHGFALATSAQAEVEAAWGLLDGMLADTGIAAQIERFEGAMGMYSLNHLLVHLANQVIRRDAGLPLERIVISERAPFLAALPAAAKGLCEIVPQHLIDARLNCGDGAYLAILFSSKGCANSALLCQELLAHLQRSHGDRFSYFDHTTVDRVVLGASAATVHCGGHAIAASRVVLCTNGFDHHTVENAAGDAVGDLPDRNVNPVIGYMAGFLEPPGAPPDATSYIRNSEIGGNLPYFYATRRQYRLGASASTLVCLGGPETAVDAASPYDPDADVPPGIIQAFEDHVRPVIAPDHPAGAGYDFAWHGLMGYTRGRIRLVGFEPRNPVLMYNLGCNGVGFLPSIAGGQRVARLHAGQSLEPSLFDPRRAPSG
jgi:glycine/D-amino acid oxidase-like deaminating enzyme